MDFDPYYNWLGIPPTDSANGGPTHYRLLGLSLFEDNADAISNAADRVMAHLRTYQTGKHAALSQQLLSEVAQARICLLDPAKKGVYDRELLARLAPAPTAEAPPPELPTAPSPVVVAPARRLAPSKPLRKYKSRALEWTLTIGGLLLLIIATLVFVYLWPSAPGERPQSSRKNEAEAIEMPRDLPRQPATTDAKEVANVAEPLPAATISDESPDNSPKTKVSAKKKKSAKKPAPKSVEKKASVQPSIDEARKLWVHSNGTFHQLDSGRWEEIAGNRTFSFVELNRNAQYIELRRNPATFVRLYEDHCEVRASEKGAYRRLYSGSWKTESHADKGEQAP